MSRHLAAGMTAGLLITGAAACALPGARESAPDPTRALIAAAVAEVLAPLEGRVVLDAARSEPGMVDAELAEVLGVDLGRRDDTLRCAAVCELIDADALIVITDIALTGDGDGARVLLLLWTAGPRAASEAALTITLRGEMVDGAPEWRVVEVAPRYLS